MTNIRSFVCLQIHLHENVFHHSSKCYSRGLRLRRLGPAFPHKSVLYPHNREYTELERSGSCTAGSEDRCEEFFLRVIPSVVACRTEDRRELLSKDSLTLSMFSRVRSFLTATSFFRYWTTHLKVGYPCFYRIV